MLLLAALTCGLFGCTEQRFPVKLEIVGRGTVIVDPEGSDYAKGTTVKFIAQSAQGYVFERWDGPVVGSSASASAVISEPLAIKAIFSETTPTIPEEALYDPIIIAKSYLIAQMEAIVQERPELIEPYFNTDCPVSAYTYAYETLRIKCLIVHFREVLGGLSWYSPDIELTLIHEDSEAAQVRGVYSGLVKLNDSKEPELFNNHELHDLYLRRRADNSWYVERDDYDMDILIRTYGKITIEDFDWILRKQQEQLHKGK